MKVINLKKMKNKCLFLLGIFIFPVMNFSQNKYDREIISSNSNRKQNELLLDQLLKNEVARKNRITDYMTKNPSIPLKTELANGEIQEIMDILPNNELIYAKTYNSGAAITAKANKMYNGGSLGLNIQGQNMTAGVWDGGAARNTHQEFIVGGNNKVSIMDGGTFVNHATHVMGTICAQGLTPAARGIAFNANGLSYDWTSDLAEMLAEASNGLLVSNHSYGFGSLSSIWFYGAYDNRAKTFDEICFNNPYYLPVVSAGNSRNETTAPGSTQISSKFGYDMIFGHGNAKNVITVAAVNEVNNYQFPYDVVMSNFSSFGPSDDGRIKPDISMKGVNVYSTLSTSNYGILSGTSMASPGITGVVLLLQQYYNQLYSNFMKSATVKGLILHTADEAGNYNGPDYEFGWGLVNTEKAATTIRNKNATIGTKSIIEELNLSNGAIYTKTVTSNGTNPLKASISWTDPQSQTFNSGTIDPSTTYLVNDLDIKITKNNTIYYPWKLQGMLAPYDAATNNSPNNVDNFERVDINNPTGTYTITVTHKGTLSGGSQNFSLIVTGDNLSTLSTNEVILSDVSKVNFFPNPAKSFIQINEEVSDVVKIYDSSGKLVLKVKPVDHKIDISNLLIGNYIVNFINNKEESKTFKFIKE